MNENEIAKIIVDAAYKIHKALGPGLLESAYQAILSYEIRKRGLKINTEVLMPLRYESKSIDAG